MPTQLELSAELKQQIGAITFPVYSYDETTCTRNLTGESEQAAEVQVCPYEVRYQPDRKTRGLKPNTWRWEVNVRTEGLVLMHDSLRELFSTFGAFPVLMPIGVDGPEYLWRIQSITAREEYRPSVNPQHGSKVKLDLTLVSY